MTPHHKDTGFTFLLVFRGKMRNLIFICTLFFSLVIQAQTYRKADTAAQKRSVDSVNRLIDRAVVNKQLSLLQKHYAEDFVFTHGTRLVDSKGSRLKNVQDTRAYIIFCGNMIPPK